MGLGVSSLMPPIASLEEINRAHYNIAQVLCFPKHLKQFLITFNIWYSTWGQASKY